MPAYSSSNLSSDISSRLAADLPLDTREAMEATDAGSLRESGLTWLKLLRQRLAFLAHWLTRHLFLILASATAVLFSPSPVFNCAILAGIFAAVPERFPLLALISGLSALIFVAQGPSFWLVLGGLLLIWPWRRRLLQDHAIAAMLLAAAALVIWQGFAAPLLSGNRLFVVMAEASAAAMLAYFYVQIMLRLRLGAKVPLATRIGLMILFFYPMLMGLGNLTVFGLTLRALAVILLVWPLSYSQDAAWGALAGLLGGLVMHRDPFTAFFWAASLGLLAALVGFTSEFGRWSSLLIYGFGLTAVNGYLISQGSQGYIMEGVVALFALGLLPGHWLERLNNRSKLFVHQPQPPHLYSAGDRIVRARLDEMSELLREMASFFQPPIAPRIASDGREAGIAHLLRERCCTGCPKLGTCLARSQDLFLAVAQNHLAAEESDARQRQRLQHFQEFCYRPEMIHQEAVHLVDLYQMNDYWQSNWNENSSLLNHQLRFSAETLQRISEEYVETRASLKPEKRFRLEVFRKQNPTFDQTICGDSVLCSEIGPYAVLAISDGMGNGAPANHESKSAMRLLERMLNLGYPPPQVLQTINSMLLARSAGECFATLDVLIVDLSDGSADIYKSGAAPSLLKRDGLVHEIPGNGLPAGVFPSLDVEKRHLPLRENDLIVLLSDGMLLLNDERGPAAALSEIVEQEDGESLSHLAERLMVLVEGHGEQELLDDRTVLLARMKRRKALGRV